MQQFYCNRNRLKILFKYYPLASLVQNSPMIFLSLAYWDSVFLRNAGPGFLLRAVAAQMRYAVQGLRERHLGSDLELERWLPWMTRQKLRDVINLRAARGET